jgi:hypothetical protein
MVFRHLLTTIAGGLLIFVLLRFFTSTPFSTAKRDTLMTIKVSSLNKCLSITDGIFPEFTVYLFTMRVHVTYRWSKWRELTWPAKGIQDRSATKCPKRHTGDKP